MVWFAATGFCVMANGLYWLGAEPRLNPESLPSGGCVECPKSGECLGGHAILAPGGNALVMTPAGISSIEPTYSLPVLSVRGN